MVWDGGWEPLVVPKRWTLLGVSLGRAPVWPCGAGVGFTERSARRRLRVTYEGGCIKTKKKQGGIMTTTVALVGIQVERTRRRYRRRGGVN